MIQGTIKGQAKAALLCSVTLLCSFTLLAQLLKERLDPPTESENCKPFLIPWAETSPCLLATKYPISKLAQWLKYFNPSPTLEAAWLLSARRLLERLPTVPETYNLNGFASNPSPSSKDNWLAAPVL